MLEALDAESKAHFEALCAHLGGAGVDYHVEPRLVRGLDYYTRTVFEWTTDALGAQSTVCAGGRYDGLVAQLGGTPTPPGSAGRWGRSASSCCSRSRAWRRQHAPPQVYLVLVGEHTEMAGFKLAERLRDAWPDLRLQINLGGGSFKTQFKRADKSGAQFALCWGMTKWPAAWSRSRRCARSWRRKSAPSRSQ